MCGIKKREKIHIRRMDILLAVSLGVLALGLLTVRMAEGKTGKTLIISWDGKVIENVSLPMIQKEENQAVFGTKYCLLLYTQNGISSEWYENDLPLSAVSVGVSYNLLSISREGVRMEAADCRDQICVYHSPITGGGESIICLPHKLAVEIRGNAEEKDMDGMVN